MNLVWEDKKIIRGIAIEANLNETDLSEIGSALSEAWLKCLDVSSQLCDGPRFSALVEIWPDSGRIIYRLSDTREFARVILSVFSLESVYYQLPEDEDAFETAYDELVERVRKDVENGLTLESAVNEIVIRDSDDEKSQQVARVAT
ncbi:MAG: hypothetical protein AAFN77_14200 [Planctomycetota bacterium]